MARTGQRVLGYSQAAPYRPEETVKRNESRSRGRVPSSPMRSGLPRLKFAFDLTLNTISQPLKYVIQVRPVSRRSWLSGRFEREVFDVSRSEHPRLKIASQPTSYTISQPLKRVRADRANFPRLLLGHFAGRERDLIPRSPESQRFVREFRLTSRDGGSRSCRSDPQMRTQSPNELLWSDERDVPVDV